MTEIAWHKYASFELMLYTSLHGADMDKVNVSIIDLLSQLIENSLLRTVSTLL